MTRALDRFGQRGLPREAPEALFFFSLFLVEIFPLFMTCYGFFTEAGEMDVI
jgi:hypothetical protein